MSDVVISVEGLGKKYRLGANAGPGYRTVRESLVDAGKGPLRKAGAIVGRKPGDGERGHRPEFWALKDVNFEVRRGEVLGIIGRNGAGKSTLLKILSQITEPTEGEVKVKGRVASLLEVGTGFHPELTGRENIYLNGAILGMCKAEIWRKFDEIVSFAAVEKFIDTPVKHYSSGMYLRLAFSVAAHLEPEILVVDEVLAVGDAEFQKKCLGKMSQVAGEGRTVLLVSHNMGAITRLCQRGVLLAGGHLASCGLAEAVVREHLRQGGGGASVCWNEQSAPGDDVARLRAVRVLSGGELAPVIEIRQPVTVEVEYEVLQGKRNLVPNLHFFNDEGTCLFVSLCRSTARPRPHRMKGRVVSAVTIPGDFFAEGGVSVRAAVTTLHPFTVHFDVADTVYFWIRDDHSGNSARGDYAGVMPGAVRPLLPWTDRYEGGVAVTGVESE